MNDSTKIKPALCPLCDYPLDAGDYRQCPKCQDFQKLSERLDQNRKKREVSSRAIYAARARHQAVAVQGDPVRSQFKRA